MRITARQLRQIIKEELQRSALNEADDSIRGQVMVAAAKLMANMGMGMYNPNPDVGGPSEKEAAISSYRYGFRVYPTIKKPGGQTHIVIACVAERPIPVMGGPFSGKPGMDPTSALIGIARENGLDKLNIGPGDRDSRANYQILTADGFARDPVIETEMPYQYIWAVPV